MSEPDRPRLWFIAGSPRSGSTLACQLLAMASGGLAVGELKDIFLAMHQRRPCSCGQPSDQCEVWGARMAELSETWTVHEQLRLQQDLNAHFRARSFATAPDTKPSQFEALAMFRRLMDGLHAAGGEGPVVDSSKGLGVLARQIAAGASEMSTIHLLRDPRAVGFSQWSSRKGLSKRAEEPPGSGTVRSAMEWATWNGQIAVAARRRTRYTQLHYEHLASDPAAAVGATLEALDHTGGNRLVVSGGGELAVDQGHILVGNPGRRRTGVRRVTLDERWKREYPVARRASVTMIAGVPRALITSGS